MSEAAREWLKQFDNLSPTDQLEVITEILHRTAASGELPEAALHDLADELFRSYDAEEAARAKSSPR